MDTCILIFTKNCLDDYTLQAQVQSLVDLYGGLDNVKIIEKPTDIDYNIIETEAENAKLEKIQNFLVLEDPKNFVALDNALNEEYGNSFIEVKAIPEQFKKFKEIDTQIQIPTGSLNTYTPRPNGLGRRPNMANLNGAQFKTSPQGNVLNLLCFDASFPTINNLKIWETNYKMYQSYNNAPTLVLPAAIIDGEQYIGGVALGDILHNWPYFNTYKSFGLEAYEMGFKKNGSIDYKDAETLKTFLTAILNERFLAINFNSSNFILNIMGANIAKWQNNLKQLTIPFKGKNVLVDIKWNPAGQVKPCYNANENKQIYEKLMALSADMNNKKRNKQNIQIKDTDKQAFKQDEQIRIYLNSLIKMLEVLKDESPHLSYGKAYRNRSWIQNYIDQELQRAAEIFKDTAIEATAKLIKFTRDRLKDKNPFEYERNTINNTNIRKDILMFYSNEYKPLCKLLQLDTKKR